MAKTKLNLNVVDKVNEKKIESIANDAPLKQMGSVSKRPKAINISITMWPQDLALLDQLCADFGVGRSAMIRILLRKYNNQDTI